MEATGVPISLSPSSLTEHRYIQSSVHSSTLNAPDLTSTKPPISAMGAPADSLTPEDACQVNGVKPVNRCFSGDEHQKKPVKFATSVFWNATARAPLKGVTYLLGLTFRTPMAIWDFVCSSAGLKRNVLGMTSIDEILDDASTVYLKQNVPDPMAIKTFIGTSTDSMKQNVAVLSSVKTDIGTSADSMKQNALDLSSVSAMGASVDSLKQNALDMSPNKTAINTSADSMRQNAPDLSSIKSAMGVSADSPKFNTMDPSSVETAIHTLADSMKHNAPDLSPVKTAISTSADSMKQNAPDLSSFKSAIGASAHSLKCNAPDLTSLHSTLLSSYDSEHQAISWTDSDVKDNGVEPVSAYLSMDEHWKKIGKPTTNVLCNAAVRASLEGVKYLLGLTLRTPMVIWDFVRSFADSLKRNLPATTSVKSSVEASADHLKQAVSWNNSAVEVSSCYFSVVEHREMFGKFMTNIIHNAAVRATQEGARYLLGKNMGITVYNILFQSIPKDDRKPDKLARKMAAVESKMAAVESKMAAVESRFAELEREVQGSGCGMDQVTENGCVYDG